MRKNIRIAVQQKVHLIPNSLNPETGLELSRHTQVRRDPNSGCAILDPCLSNVPITRHDTAALIRERFVAGWRPSPAQCGADAALSGD